MKKIIFASLMIIVAGFLGVYFFMPGTMFGLILKGERKAAGFESKSVEVNGLRIEYLEGGHAYDVEIITGQGLQNI